MSTPSRKLRTALPIHSCTQSSSAVRRASTRTHLRPPTAPIARSPPAVYDRQRPRSRVCPLLTDRLKLTSTLSVQGPLQGNPSMVKRIVGACPDYPDGRCDLDGQGRLRILEVGGGANVRMENFRILNGMANVGTASWAAPDGGGILVESSSGAAVTSMELRDVSFVNSNARRHGGGLACRNANMTVVNGHFKENSAMYAGGGFVGVGCLTSVHNSTFERALRLPPALRPVPP